MSFVGDLHLHSRFSRACSKDLNIPNLAKWAKIKGIDLLGTGDFLHPVWQEELKAQLREVDEGIFDYQGVRFILTNEISLSYFDHSRLRRVHLILVFSSFKAVQKLAQILLKRGVNLASDGRPMLGISIKEITSIIFDIEPFALVIPAHIWTPWFGLFGARSGYDSLAESFGGLKNKILAVETGLSSDPAMNWRISDLDTCSIVSFSDAHSLSKLGRELTVFCSNLTFKGVWNDLKNQDLMETIEFFPEEGKYHWSGHRSCQVVYSPENVIKDGSICPVCGRELTIGVMQRVNTLSDRSQPQLQLKTEYGLIKSQVIPKRVGYRMLVGLEKIISEALSVSSTSLKVRRQYFDLIQKLGSELQILTKISLSEIAKIGGEKVAEGIDRVRKGRLKIDPGFDGVYGKVRIWSDQENISQTKQISFLQE